jgi:GGDEF domain-containing protein
VSGRPIGHIASLNLSAGVAELGESDDGTSLFERADEALYRAKDAGKSRAFPALTIQKDEEPEANSTSA